MDERLTYLYQRYIEKTCTDQELKEFFQCLEDLKNEDQIRLLLDHTFDSESEINFPASRKELLYHKVSKEITGHGTKSKRWIPFIKYSAAAVILCFGAWFYWSKDLVTRDIKSTADEVSMTQRDSIIVLPDSSIVVLNTGATIEYGPDYGQKDRLVKLQGEAYFKVIRDEHHPFLVQTALGLTTRVLGTKFNVDASISEQVEVTVTEGKVQVEKNDKILHVLEANEQLTYSLPQQAYSAKVVDASQVVSWQHKDLYFNEATLDQIVGRLANKYKVSITLKDPALGRVRFSATFLHDESLEDILSSISAFLDVKYEADVKGNITIYR